MSVYMCLVVTWWERAGLLALVCGVLTVSLSFSHRYPGSGVVLDCSIPDLCTLTYFVKSRPISKAQFKPLCTGHTLRMPTKALLDYKSFSKLSQYIRTNGLVWDGVTDFKTSLLSISSYVLACII